MERIPTHKERLDVAADALVTAVEGGSNYWASFFTHGNYYVADEGPDIEGSVPGYLMAEVTYEDPETGVETCTDVFVANILDTMRAIADGTITVDVRDDIYYAIRTAYLDTENADIDAEAADVLLQVTLFGSVIFG